MQPCLDVRNYCGMLRSNSARSCNKTFLRGIVGRSVTLDNRLWEMELTEQELSLFFFYHSSPLFGLRIFLPLTLYNTTNCKVCVKSAL